MGSERTVTVGAIEVVVSEAGAGGRPLLLVHGFTGAKEDFGDQLDLLGDSGWHAMAPDLRGHGASSAPADESAYSLEIFVADLLGLVDQLGWDRFVLLGHSMGGMIAQVLALAHPDRLDGLVLMDTHHGSVSIDAELVELAVELTRSGGIEALKAAISEIDDPLTTPAFERLLVERPGYQEFCDGKLLASSPAMYAAMARVITSTATRLDDLTTLGVPTLVLVGEQDGDFVDASAAMAAAIPGSRLVVIRDAGHSPQFENPDAWLATLEGFLAEMPIP